MSVIVVSSPPALVSLALAKQHLRVDVSDDDDLIAFYIAAAQATIDGPGGSLGRCIGVQTLEYRIDGFPSPIWAWSHGGGDLFYGSTPDYVSGAHHSARIPLPYPPLKSVTSVTYQDEGGQQQSLPSAEYLASDEGLDASFGATFPAGRWQPGAVRIRYQAGYDTIPPSIVAAMLLMVGDLYANRTSVETGLRAAAVAIPMSTTIDALLAPFRVVL